MDNDIFSSLSSLAISLVVAIILFLLPTKPSWLIILLLCLILLLLLYPIWKNPKIKDFIVKLCMTLLVIITLIGMAVYIWPRIIINPNKIYFSASEWNVTKVIEIKNNLDTIYSAWIKIEGESGDIDLDKTVVLPEVREGFPSGEAGPIDINFAFSKFKGLDSENKPCIYLLIFRLKALESMFITIKGVAKQGGNLPLIVSLRVMNYSDKPADIPSSDNKVGMVFSPPEKFTINSWEVMMKRK